MSAIVRTGNRVAIVIDSTFLQGTKGVINRTGCFDCQKAIACERSV
jgi:hypothetical protein